MTSGGADTTRRPWGLALSGSALVLLGAVGYFVVVTQFPGRLQSMRNHAVPNWLLIGLGLTLGWLAVRRAHRRWTPRLLLGFNCVVAVLFAAMLYGMLRVPATSGPAIGQPAPEFAQLDQSGQRVRLSDFRGAPLLLVFYRGHW